MCIFIDKHNRWCFSFSQLNHCFFFNLKRLNRTDIQIAVERFAPGLVIAAQAVKRVVIKDLNFKLTPGDV